MNIFELYYTLTYIFDNDLAAPYLPLYLFSIIMTFILHCLVFMYVHRFTKLKTEKLLNKILSYLLFIIIGILSYFKLLPFILYLTRDKSNAEFSFSQVNKYLLLTAPNR